MMLLFFPSSLFAWVFSAGLLALLAAASWTDLRRMVVPKWITLTTLGLGAAANMARGCWLGWCGLSTWVLGPGWGWGLLDGLLFTLAGVAVAFGIMFGMWILGVCGGGDVKLYAAVGAWVGPWNILPVLILAACCLVMVGFVSMAGRLLQGKATRTSAPRKPSKRRLVVFSWPLALGTLLVLAFLLGNDLMTLRGARPVHGPVQNQAP
jgi:Flp pilus assembly protein protease CpaA